MPARTALSLKALAALALPGVADLDETRAASRTCVWGGELLVNETAVDLGVQLTDGRTWFPRSCETCVAQRAYLARTAHAPMCAACRSDVSVDCPLGAELRRLVAVHTPVRYCSRCCRQIAPGEEYGTEPRQSPSGAGGATVHAHTVCSRGRRR
ncbi:hypothetical protein RM863_08080 [Streptomyces sp. DSM 41014]|uniref:Uncharacterized protein n=1 Tax=Streptomyces hintoniae TaxID=3075521 RepID=A0ABU2UFR2_9ACTN|nr:hypothetical protein [Streptomyces sp. DSM 41014]MDT0472083.1 hypothetical protein [Streptomyces sp. DSM 41014]